MRPEVAAFRELDTLVRNLTDQLAGYRRRALSAESRARELEQQLGVLETAADESRRECAVLSESREHALAAAREATASAKAARDALVELEQAGSSTTESSSVFPLTTDTDASSVPVVASAPASAEMLVENERLRATLAEARERTALLADRVRFLRQQLMTGAER